MIGVDFSRLGPLRAELLLKGQTLTLRLTTTREAVRRRIARDVDHLRERLAGEGRSVRISVVLGEVADTEVDSLARDVRLLREHHLMDVSG